MKNRNSKLTLNKETVSALTNNEMSNVKGGFTYGLSLGHRCKNSERLGADSQLDCGVKVEEERLAKLNTH